MSLATTLLVTCHDRTGIVAALSDFVFRNGGNIIELDQHSEKATGQFHMRLVFDRAAFELDSDGIDHALQALAQRFQMTWQLFSEDQRPRVAVFCSKASHCLYDLLIRQRMDELPGDLVCVISNHPDLQHVTEHFGVPFHHVPITADTRAEAEAEQHRLLAHYQADCLVLARYMQILSSEFCATWAKRAINIHHSFLPAFAGAKPYHQAQERGVKIIGATAHYVTADLDQGPIIEQDVIRVSHRDEVEDLVRKGRDIERQVLARAVRLHLEHRVLVDGNRTVAFT